MGLTLDRVGSAGRQRHISLVGTSGRDANAQKRHSNHRFGLERAVSSASPVRQVTSCARRRGRVGAVVRPPGCQRDSFWLPSCMCTSTAHASLLPAAERATRPTANISTSPRRSAPACKRRAQSTSMSLSDRLEILGEQAQMYPQGTRKASKVGCKAHRAQLRTHQNAHCIFRTEE
mgnify:CR=1 FL=1